MADKVNAGRPAGMGDNDQKFAPHPEGPVMMVCVDVVDLGEAVVRYQNNPPYLCHKAALVFASGLKNAEGTLWEVAREFTVSTGKKSKLRPFLESWRGKPYDGDYPDVALDKLVNHPAYCAISHAKSETTGYTYANITSIAPTPPGTPKPTITGYTRLDRWEKKRTAYKADADAFRESIGAPPSDDFESAPAGVGADDLPF